MFGDRKSPSSCFIAFVLIFSSLVPARFVFAKGREVKNPFHKVDPKALPFANPEGDLSLFKTALTRQMETCRKQDLNAKFRIGDRLVTRQKWCIETNQKFLEIASSASSFAEAIERAKTTFEWYQTEGRDGLGDVLFTGYNFPVLDASLSATPDFQFPLYRTPDDLVQVVENGNRVWRKRNADGTYSLYPDRQAIDFGGALSGRGFEIAYINDLFSAFLFQVEGAGAVLIPQPDGSKKRIVLNFESQNGRPYVEISRVLRQQGVEEEYLTVPGMRRYFKKFPEKLVPTLSANPSYVFFHAGDTGPYGVNSILLTPRHSVAVDLKVFPVGAVTLFQTQRPEMDGEDVMGWKEFSTLAVTQDTGGAIRGPGHIDIYWGEDQYSESAAGLMKEGGTLFIGILP